MLLDRALELPSRLWDWCVISVRRCAGEGRGWCRPGGAACRIFGFLGPNGAGQVYHGRMLHTLLRPKRPGSGRGFDMSCIPTRCAATSVSPAGPAIDPLMTGTELLPCRRCCYGLPRSQRRSRTHERLERLGLTAAADRRVGAYSGGCAAVDLALRCSTSLGAVPRRGHHRLDPMSRIALWEEIRRLNTEAPPSCSPPSTWRRPTIWRERVAIIDHGRIVRRGRPTDQKVEVGGPTLFVSVPPDQAEVSSPARRIRRATSVGRGGAVRRPRRRRSGGVGRGAPAGRRRRHGAQTAAPDQPRRRLRGSDRLSPRGRPPPLPARPRAIRTDVVVGVD